MKCYARVMLLSGILMVASSSGAFAAGAYIGVAGGASIFHDSDVKTAGYPTVTASYKTGGGVNINAGASFDGGGRIEGEFGYKKADLDKFSVGGHSASATGVDATIYSYMINGLYDFKTQSAFTPYIGGGVGFLKASMNDNGYKTDDTALGYQLIVGAGIVVNPTVTIDISYRLQGAASDFNIDGSDVSYLSSNIYGGLRFNF